MAFLSVLSNVRHNRERPVGMQLSNFSRWHQSFVNVTVQLIKNDTFLDLPFT